MVTFKHLNESFDKKFKTILDEATGLNESYTYPYVKWVKRADNNSWVMWGGSTTSDLDPDFLNRINHPNYPNPKYNIENQYLDAKILPAGEEPINDNNEYDESFKGKMPNKPITNKGLKKKKNKNLKEALYRYSFKDDDGNFVFELTASSTEEAIKKGDAIEANRATTNRPFEELDEIATELYDNQDDFSFHFFSDDELSTLWAHCMKMGCAYDDEVFEAISDFANSDDIFAKARKIAGNLNDVGGYDEALDKGKFKRAKQPSKKPIKENATDDTKNLYRFVVNEYRKAFEIGTDKAWESFYNKVSKKANQLSSQLHGDKIDVDALIDAAMEFYDDEPLKEAKMYDLTPQGDSRKSFYGKAKVMINDDGSETLYSYNTPIMTRTKDGNYKKHWDGWSNTTGRHIAEFSGMNKKKYSELPVEESIERKRNR